MVLSFDRKLYYDTNLSKLLLLFKYFVSYNYLYCLRDSTHCCVHGGMLFGYDGVGMGVMLTAVPKIKTNLTFT